jgi:hypothetical protein
MTEEERKNNQRYYLERCRQEGWLDEQGNHLWPEDTEARSSMGRGLFGLALTNSLDSIFITWRDTIQNPKAKVFASMTPEQKEAVLRAIDDVLDFAAYEFAITLDRFDHGELSVQLTTVNDHQEPKFTIPIHPHGFLDMFQDVLEWKEKFGRGTDIGRSVSK